ncbi:MAG TPA: ribonuclease R [Flavobacterium sp.]|nr:ribonuclease R [Flavobacterium sp.]
MTRKIKRKNKKSKDYSNQILKFLAKNSTKSFNYKQIAAALDIKDTNGRNTIIKNLKTLTAQQVLEEEERGKYIINVQNNYYEGIIDMTQQKSAYLVCEGLEDDVYISTNNLNKAFDGDLVKAYVYQRRKSKKPEAEVVEIIERNRTEFAGIVQMHKDFAFVVPMQSKVYVDFFVPKDKLGDAQDGEVVLVEMTDWSTKSKNPYAVVKKVLGKPGEHQTEMHAILAEYGLPAEFPEEVERFAQNIDTSITEDEISKRRDMRDILTFTIDPKDAKDFDDALSFRQLDNGNYEIGVHIADVSHYLQEGTILDNEAYQRATSVYLVDRVVPMLPEVLSNFACSLRPNEEKYTFSAVFELNDKAEIINQWFGRTVTLSDQRLAYEEAQYIIETEDTTIPEEISITGEAQQINQNVAQAVLKLNHLAEQLRTKRMSHGAISFDKVEVKFNLDEENNPVGVYFKEAKAANHLIEEFMLLANRKVSEFIGKQKKTFVYRIHDEPDQEKLYNLQGIVGKFGYKLNFKSPKTISQSLNQLLSDVRGKGEQNMVDTLAIRTMSKAVYSTNNIGHYGLAFDYYSHFTSPIRRYPDVMVHRLLQHYLDGGKSVSEEVYEEKCTHCSNREVMATNAERDSIKYMQVKFMSDHIGEEFLGVISGVTEWGIYVEIIDNKCEGMIRTREIRDDYYTFDEKQYALVGEASGNTYQLGDEVMVKVKNTDLVQKHLDFALVGKVEK